MKELDESGILERQAYNEIPPRVDYRLTNKGQELVEPVIDPNDGTMLDPSTGTVATGGAEAPVTITDRDEGASHLLCT